MFLSYIFFGGNSIFRLFFRILSTIDRASGFTSFIIYSKWTIILWIFQKLVTLENYFYSNQTNFNIRIHLFSGVYWTLLKLYEYNGISSSQIPRGIYIICISKNLQSPMKYNIDSVGCIRGRRCWFQSFYGALSYFQGAVSGTCLRFHQIIHYMEIRNFIMPLLVLFHPISYWLKFGDLRWKFQFTFWKKLGSPEWIKRK